MNQVPVNVVSAGTVKRETLTRKMYRLQRAFLDAVTPEGMAGIAEKLQEKAREGSVTAAKLMMGYVFGLPGRPLAGQINGIEEERATAEALARQAEEGMRALAEGKTVDLETEALLAELLGPRGAAGAAEATPSANGVNGGNGRRRRK